MFKACFRGLAGSGFRDLLPRQVRSTALVSLMGIRVGGLTEFNVLLQKLLSEEPFWSPKRPKPETPKL